MKNLFLLSLLLLISCTPKIPVEKFYLNQKVIVSKGFYKGCTGIVTSTYLSLKYPTTVYRLKDAICSNVNEYSIDVYEEELSNG